MNESIQNFIDRSVIVLNSLTPAFLAAQTMSERQIGCVLVCNEESQIVGMITDRDLAIHVLGFQRSASVPIGEVMSGELVCVDRSARLSDVLRQMEEYGIRRIPVIETTDDEKETCLGLITLDDLILAQVVPMSRLSQIVKAQLIRRLHRAHITSRAKLSREQTLSRFYQTMSEHLDLSTSMTEKVTIYLIKEFLQKVPAVNASHFVAQLPSLLHETMMETPAGPNREIRAGKILEDLQHEFDFSKTESQRVVQNFWVGLRRAMNPQIVDYLGALLPRDFRHLVHHDDQASGDLYLHESMVIQERAHL